MLDTSYSSFIYELFSDFGTMWRRLLIFLYFWKYLYEIH